MGKVEIPKKVRAEDYKPEERDLIARLSDVINDLADSFYFEMTKSLDFENLNRDLVTVTVNINGVGRVSNLPQVRYNLRSRPRGVTCVAATNLANPNIYPTGAPFVSWTITSNNNLQVLNVTGLQNNSQYLLTLEIIG